MQRFVYSPKVEVYVKLDDAQRGFKTVSLTDDVIGGSVTRRLNAVSEMSLTLQNKYGKYTETNQIRPMDRIIVRLSRVGTPFLVFSGYVDEAPYYQLYPGPVTVKASCPLKLLQYTFFDPGLSYLTTYFGNIGGGWQYNPQNGSLFIPSGTTGNFDVYAGVHKIIERTLIDIGSWPDNAIDILDLPVGFLQQMAKAMNQELSDEAILEQRVLDDLKQLFGSAGMGGVVPGDPGANPGTGNIAAAKVAKLALDAGFTDQQAITAVAIARAESSFVVDAENYNSGATPKSYDWGLWQINSVHAPGSVAVDLPPPGSALPSWAQNFKQQMFDPVRNAAQAYATSSSGTNFNPWTTYTTGDPSRSYKQYLDMAQAAVGDALLGIGGTTTGSSGGTTGGTTTSPQTSPPTNTKFLFPIWVYTGFTFQLDSNQAVIGSPDGNFGNNRGDHIHAGLDIPCNEGTPLVACVNGSIIVNTTQPGVGGGNYIVLKDKNSDYTYIYMHMHEPSTWPVGAEVTMGQVIGRAGHSGTTSGFNHLHFEVHPHGGFGYSSAVNPAPILQRAFTSGDKTTAPPTNDTIPGGSSTPGAGTGSQQDQVAMALQTAWFVLQLQTNDSALSNILTGPRAIANDISFLQWIDNMVQSSGRVFTTKPDGTFFAFYPDRFGYFDNTPYFRISDIELLDFTIQRNDTELATHVFATGTYISQQQSISPFDRLNSMVASVESAAFRYFINEDPNDPQATPQQAFDPFAFLRKYGARPLAKDFADVREPRLLWMAAWMEFTKQWSLQYKTDASMTFMPELLPGGLVEIGGRITMFCEEVTHSFDREGGFTTQASLSSPATLNRNLNQFPGLPIEGGRFNDSDYLDFRDPTQFGNDLPNR
jgi:murein DD-endopeptidase MepM/ murein hydrolase activator NlpD